MGGIINKVTPIIGLKTVPLNPPELVHSSYARSNKAIFCMCFSKQAEFLNLLHIHSPYSDTFHAIPSLSPSSIRHSHYSTFTHLSHKSLNLLYIHIYTTLHNIIVHGLFHSLSGHHFLNKYIFPYLKLLSINISSKYFI